MTCCPSCRSPLFLLPCRPPPAPPPTAAPAGLPLATDLRRLATPAAPLLLASVESMATTTRRARSLPSALLLLVWLRCAQLCLLCAPLEGVPCCGTARGVACSLDSGTIAGCLVHLTGSCRQARRVLRMHACIDIGAFIVATGIAGVEHACMHIGAFHARAAIQLARGAPCAPYDVV